MNLAEVDKLVFELSLGEQFVAYSLRSGTKVALRRTDKHAQGDFVVELIYPQGKTLRPTHARLLIDIYIKGLSDRERLEVSLLPAVEGVFAGISPEVYLDNLGTYPIQIDEPDTQLCYIQLMMAEHDFKFGPRGYKEAKILPPREYLMRFIRWAASGVEIDRVITLAVRNYPPPARFASVKDSGVAKSARRKAD